MQSHAAGLETERSGSPGKTEAVTDRYRWKPFHGPDCPWRSRNIEAYPGPFSGYIPSSQSNPNIRPGAGLYQPPQVSSGWNDRAGCRSRTEKHPQSWISSGNNESFDSLL